LPVVRYILPSALLVGFLAWVYQRYGSAPQIGALLFGVKPVVVALIAQAVWSLGRVALKSVELGVLGAVVLGLAAWHVSAIALLIGAGVAWIVTERFGGKQGSAVGAGGILAQTGASTAGVSIPTVAGVFLYFLKVGAVLFGERLRSAGAAAGGFGGAAALADGENQLIDAIAISQGTPGPFFTVATFVGYVISGWRGAVLATFGIVFAGVCVCGDYGEVSAEVAQSPTAGAFLDGVNAAAVALMAFVGWQFARETLLSVPAL